MNAAMRIPDLFRELTYRRQALSPHSIGLFRDISGFSVVLLFSLFAQFNWALPGDLDSTFGGAFGRYFINTESGQFDGATAVAAQRDGKLVIAGTCGSGASADFCILRRNANGSIDNTFGYSLSGGISRITLTTLADYPAGIVIQRDDKIVIAGTCVRFGVRSFCMTRLLANGQFDVDFGLGGVVNQVVGAGDASVTALLLQPDGKLVVAGSCFDGTFNTLCAARFLPGGAFDNSFGNQGRRFFTVNSNARGYAAALRSDGRILIAGSCNNGTSMCVGQLTASGNIDVSFTQIDEFIPTDGIAIASNGGSDAANGIAIQADQKIVLGGGCPLNSQPAFCATRLDANGFPDNEFGVVGAPDRIVRFNLGTTNAVASAVALQNDGRILLVGACLSANSDFCLLRLNDNGSTDQSFGSVGIVKTNVVDANDFGYATLIQPDGKIVVAGQCSESSAPSDAAMCIARYEGGPFGARNCSFDIDGDGAVLGTTDQLILARIARGVNTSAALGGIVFAPHATRSTWPTIRTYLVAQCGIALP
jgi:uncharacterized delta-60 repeat protein